MNKTSFLKDDLVSVNEKGHIIETGKGFGIIRSIDEANGRFDILVVESENDGFLNAMITEEAENVEHKERGVLEEIFAVPVYYEFKGFIEVRAKTIEEAADIVSKGDHKLPTDGEFVEGSFEVDFYGLGLDDEN